MSDKDNFQKRPILGRRVLVPNFDLSEARPSVNTNSPQSESNTTFEIQVEEKEMKNMTSNDDFKDKLRALHASILDEEEAKQKDQQIINQDKKIDVQYEYTMPAKNFQFTPGESSDTKGNFFFKMPLNNPPMGGNIHCIKWNSPTDFELIEASGSAADYVRYNQWHLNGASVWIGTSATGADDHVGVDPAAGVTGLIPQAVKHISEMVKTSKRLSQKERGLDSQGRPYQFAVIAVIGGQDHAAIERHMNDLKMNKSYGEAFKSLGIQGISFRSALYNDMGKLFALEVSFTNKETYGHGRHLIFLHPANDIGGGKSAESLMDRRLTSQASALAKEFEWWIAALERGDGKIGAIETTLGGTALRGRYAMLSARVPRTLFAEDACEIVNVDRADWVRENLFSEIQEYRSNFATTLLTTAWGKVSEKYHGIPIQLVDRFDRSMVNTRRKRAIIAILRHMFLGHPDLDLLKGDISDERIAQRREEAITNSDMMTIYDTAEKNLKGPWKQQRRIRLSTSINITPSKIMSLARNDDPHMAIDNAEAVLEKLRSLATSQNGALHSGGFTVIDALVPKHILESQDNIVTPQTVGKAMESIAQGLRAQGIDKPLVNLYQLPQGISGDLDEIIVQITEDQPGNNILMVSTEEVETHSKRIIMQNPDLKSISNNTVSTVFAFGRLLGRMVTAHQMSGYKHCEDDGDLIHAFHRHYYGGRFGNRPNRLLGGNNRVRKKIENKGEGE
ncbi:MAG: hypothetical protein QGI21_06810 [Candidatus Poseidoniaceae archaeon]|nr:hypothetical protein [Candidatus Poseidoniaceae archaeon]